MYSELAGLDNTILGTIDIEGRERKEINSF
jgi:hypothetical protein